MAMGLFAVLKKIGLPPLVTIEPTDDVACRRAVVRHNQKVMDGHLKSENMAFARACRIMDLSEMGAQLELWEDEIASALLGGEMTLFFSSEQAEVDCRVAWRKGRRLGVCFRGKHRRAPKRGHAG